jgi:hypothetical protein
LSRLHPLLAPAGEEAKLHVGHRGSVARVRDVAHDCDMRRSVLLCLPLLAGCYVGLPATTPATPATAASREDPFPECAAIRRWFQENLGDPQSFEALSWHRDTYQFTGVRDRPRPGGPATLTRIRVRYRAKNGFGGLAVSEKTFFARDGRVSPFLSDF